MTARIRALGVPTSLCHHHRHLPVHLRAPGIADFAVFSIYCLVCSSSWPSQCLHIRSSATSREFRGHVTHSPQRTHSAKSVMTNSNYVSPWETVINRQNIRRSISADGLIALYHKPSPICDHLAKGHIVFQFPHLFHSRYEPSTFHILPVVVQLRLARLHNPDRDKFNRSSICQTTREV